MRPPVVSSIGSNLKVTAAPRPRGSSVIIFVEPTAFQEQAHPLDLQKRIVAWFDYAGRYDAAFFKLQAMHEFDISRNPLKKIGPKGYPVRQG